jgi:hypothetical protein
VQVRLDDARLPMPFDQIQCADLRGWHGDTSGAAWRGVMDGICELTECDMPAAAQSRPSADRRGFLVAGGATAAFAAAGWAGWRYLDRPRVSPQAQLLIQKGMDALQQNDALETQDPGSSLTAIALLSEATQAAPESAMAWGGLAMAYAVRKRIVPLAERPGLDSRSRSAAKTALDIDPTEGRALGALRMLEPPYRNWMQVERGDREALKKNPRIPILLFIMSDMLGHVGRWKEAVEFSSKFDRRKFMLPGADRKVIVNLWAAGDLAGADNALDTAVKQWPQHPQIFRARVTYLMYTGRPLETLELLGRQADLPVEIKPDFIAAVRATAQGLAGQLAPAAAAKAALAYLETNPQSALQVAQACVALGEAATAHEIFRGYYFGEGRWSKLAPLGGDEDRMTSILFQPPMRGIWGDPRFDQLLDRIGLSNYWRQSGTVPDFRKLA